MLQADSVVRCTSAGDVVLTASAAFLGRPVLSRSLADPVAFVIDGDTISLAGERIRLLGIDAPESLHSLQDEWALGLEAKARLIVLLGERPIRIEQAGQHRCGHTPAKVFASGADVGAVLLREDPGAAPRARSGCRDRKAQDLVRLND